MVKIAINNHAEAMVITSQAPLTDWNDTVVSTGYDIMIDCVPEVRFVCKEIFLRGRKSNRDFEEMNIDVKVLRSLAEIADTSVGNLLIDSWDYSGLKNNINNI